MAGPRAELPLRIDVLPRFPAANSLNNQEISKLIGRKRCDPSQFVSGCIAQLQEEEGRIPGGSGIA